MHITQRNTGTGTCSQVRRPMNPFTRKRHLFRAGNTSRIDGWVGGKKRRSYYVLGARRATRGLKPGHAFLEFAPDVRLKKSGILMTGQVKRSSNLFFFVSWIGGLEQVQRTTVGGREGFEPCCLPLAFIGCSLTSRETKSNNRSSVKSFSGWFCRMPCAAVNSSSSVLVMRSATRPLCTSARYLHISYIRQRRRCHSAQSGAPGRRASEMRLEAGRHTPLHRAEPRAGLLCQFLFP